MRRCPSSFRHCARAPSNSLERSPKAPSPGSALPPTCATRLCRGATRMGRARPKLIAHAFLARTSDATELKQGVDEFLVHYPRLTNYQEMFAAAGYPEARQGAWSARMIEAVVLHGTDDRCREKLESFM